MKIRKDTAMNKDENKEFSFNTEHLALAGYALLNSLVTLLVKKGLVDQQEIQRMFEDLSEKIVESPTTTDANKIAAQLILRSMPN